MQPEAERGVVPNEPNYQEIGEFALSQITEINLRIHYLTRPEIPITVSTQEVIKQLGIAGAHLSLITSIPNTETTAERTQAIPTVAETPSVSLLPESTETSEVYKTPDVEDQPDEDLQLHIDGFVDEFCVKNKFNQRDKTIIKQIIAQFKDLEWFKTGSINISPDAYPAEASRQAGVAKLTTKLAELGILVSNGERGGGRKHKISHPIMLEIRNREVKGDKPVELNEAEITPPSRSFVETPSLQPVPRSQPERIKRFVEIMTESILDSIANHTNGLVRVSEIRKNMHEYLGTNEDDSNAAIANLINAGYFRSASFKGSKYLARGASLTVEKPSVSVDKTPEHQDDKIWTQRDVGIAVALFQNLLRPGDPNRGIQIENFMRAEGIVEREDKVRLKDSLRRMQKLDYIYIDQATVPAGNTGYIDRFRYSTVTFKNRQIETRARTSWKSLLKELNDKVGQNVSSR